MRSHGAGWLSRSWCEKKGMNAVECWIIWPYCWMLMGLDYYVNFAMFVIGRHTMNTCTNFSGQSSQTKTRCTPLQTSHTPFALRWRPGHHLVHNFRHVGEGRKTCMCVKDEKLSAEIVYLLPPIPPCPPWHAA